MPSTGTPSRNTPGSTEGAPGSYTEAGPPERISPAGRRALSSAAVRSCGTISEYTRHSRTRRAMSCAYWAPRSRTRTGRASESPAGRSGEGSGLTRSVPHPDALLRLIGLALGLDAGRDDELGLLELLDRGVARRRHRGCEGPEQVEGAVVLVRRPDEDLAQRGDLLGLHACPARQGRMKRRHAPVVAAAGSLVRAGQRRADHDGVGASGDRLGDVAAGPHAAVGDHVAVAPGLPQL